MKKATVHVLKRQGFAHDPLTQVIRDGARRILCQALEAEVESFIDHFGELKVADGRQRVIRNGFLPGREVVTGIGNIPVTVPRTRDRGVDSTDRIIFSSKIVPPYIRKAGNVEAVLPWLYLKGVSSGSFHEALEMLVGPDASGLSSTVICRLKNKWQDEFKEWNTRSLIGKRYVYIWADGIYFNVRMEDEKRCMLVILGALEDGTKELVGVLDGYRESADSWAELLRDLKTRGMTFQPKLAIGDGALGFWKALAGVFPETKMQRCWKHKSANVLDKLPKSEQEKALGMLHDIWMASTKKKAEKAWDDFVKVFKVKHPKAIECLQKDKDAMLAFYDFPAEHWQHIRTSNPVESPFSTVRNRTNTTRGCLSRNNMLAMVFKLVMSAQKRWRALNMAEKLKDLTNGVTFVDGEYEVAA